MAFQKLQFKPGVNRDQTNYSNEGGWYECDKIRFFSGYPQKLGGWQKTTPNTFIGTCRQMWNWITSYNDNFLALGTNVKAYIEVAGTFYDITPLRTTLTSPATDNCVDTTNTSRVVNINVVGHGCETGDYVTISGVTGSGSPSAIGGIPITEINAEHEVTRVDADNFTITVTTPANLGAFWGSGAWSAGTWGLGASATTFTGGGTNITIEFEINIGYPITVAGYGWGTSTWGGAFGWGLSSPTPVYLQQRDWWFDNFDNDLVMNIRNGKIYYWERGTLTNPSTALDTRAVLLSSLTGASDVPTTAMQTLVSQNDKHLLAFGCQPYGGLSTDFDPLLIRWANQDEPQNWTPSTATSAVQYPYAEALMET